jgi:hypothetical protein
MTVSSRASAREAPERQDAARRYPDAMFGPLTLRTLTDYATCCTLHADYPGVVIITTPR